MKNIVITLLLFGIISCNKPEVKLPDNFISAERNDTDWSGTIEIRHQEGTDTLVLQGLNIGPCCEALVMKIRFEGVGSYELTNREGYYYTLLGGDVFTSEYKLPPGRVGELIISEYDPENKTLEGDFDLLLKKIRSNPENEVDTVHFTNGLFRGRIAD